MIATLALMLVLSQDPKPAAKTVEERLKELADRIESLDKKAAALADENAKLQVKVDEATARRELLARQPGPVWVKRYAPDVEFSEKQSLEIQELWYAWTKQDFEKPCDVAGWKGREDLLRSKLTSEQGSKLALKVREEQESGVTFMIKNLVRVAKLPLHAEDAVEKVVRPRVKLEDGILLPAAHPEKSPSWTQLAEIVESNRSELSPALSAGEIDALLKAASAWKPKR
jgi:hypothetical protein